jgi:hypothetical protein
MSCVELGRLIALLVGMLQISALPRAPYQERQRFDDLLGRG